MILMKRFILSLCAAALLTDAAAQRIKSPLDADWYLVAQR